MYTDMKAESVRETRQIAAWLHIKTSWLTDCPSHQPDSGSESGTDSSPGSPGPLEASISLLASESNGSESAQVTGCD